MSNPLGSVRTLEISGSEGEIMEERHGRKTKLLGL